MARAAFAVFGIVTLGLVTASACGGVEHPDYGPNAPCTRSKDCRRGLACVEGVCVDPDAPTPAATVPDAASDAGDGG